MNQLSQRSQIHYKPEVCTDKSEILISKKQKRSRFVIFTQVLVLFSLISIAHTSSSEISDEVLLGYTDNVIAEVIALINSGKSLKYADIQKIVGKHFPPGTNSITTAQIQTLTDHFADALTDAGIDASQLATWFKSALDIYQ